MAKRWLVLFLTTLFTVVACHSPVYNQTEANAADVKIRASDARRKAVRDALPAPALVVNPGLYVDTTPISLARMPSWMSSPVVMRGDQLPFSYYTRTIASGAGRNVLVEYQPDLDPSVNFSMSYTGTIKGALDLIASKTGYVYVVNGRKIYWKSMITRTFDVAFMPGTSDYLMGNSSGTSGTTQASSSTAGTVANYVNSDYSSSEFSSLKGTLSIWDDLKNTLTALKSPGGQVVVSQSTTTVTVRDKPTNVAMMEKYIKELNHKLGKQVLVKIQVLDVQLENDFTFGINWMLIAKALTNSNFVLNANYGTPVSITPFTPQPGQADATATILPQFGTVPVLNSSGVPKIPSYGVLFNALNQQGKTSVVTEPQAVCMNNQVSVIRSVSSQSYVASVQNTALAGTGTSGAGGTTNIGTVTSQITPGTVITGTTVYILPKIMGDKVYLQVNADLSTLNSITQLGTGTNILQNPNVTLKHFNQRSVIRSGDTLVLSGYRQLRNVANANQFITSQALGGKGSQMQNFETIILITPFILPEKV